MKKKRNSSMYKWILVIVLLSLFIIWPMFRSGYWESDDGEWMVIRFSAFHESLTDGHFPVRWTQRLNHEFGYPVMNFLYPLPFYLAELPKTLGLGFVDSVKVVFASSVVISGIGMFLYAKKWGRLEGLLASILYLFAPYRFFVLYTRGSLGESVALAFVPFLFYLLDRLFKKPNMNNTLLSGIIYATLIMSHNVIALLFTPIAILYVFFKRTSKKFSLTYPLFALTIGLLLSAFFWLPAIAELQYTRAANLVISNYSQYLLNDPQLISRLGPIHMFVIAAGLILGAKFFSIIGIVVAFLMHTSFSHITQFVPLIQKIQFPWRMSTVFMFASAATGAKVISSKQIKKRVKPFIVIIIGAIFIALSFNQTYGIRYVSRDEGFYTTNDDTTTVQNEFTPIWVMNDPKNKVDQMFEIKSHSGKYEITGEDHRTGFHFFQIRLKDEVIIKANIHYFPGWEIYVDDKRIELDPSQTNDLLEVLVTPIEFKLRDVKFVFESTPIRKISEWISIIAAVGITAYFIFKYFGKKDWKKALGITTGTIAILTITFFLLSNLHTFSDTFDPRISEQKYLNSQWIEGDAGKNVPIGDSGLYAWAGWEYVHGINPILINPEMPPMGKYIIGLGLLTLHRPAVIGLIFNGFALLSHFFLAKEVVKNKWLAITSTALLSTEPIMRNLLNLTMLDGLQLGFLNLSFLFFIKGLKNKPWFILSSLMLGAMASTKFYASSASVIGSLLLYLIISRKWRELWYFTFTLPIVALVHTFQYIVYFLDGNSLRGYLGVQKWIYTFYKQGNVGTIPAGSYWLLVLFNRWRVWFTDEWGVYKTITSDLWRFSWPLNLFAVCSSVYLSLKKQFQEGQNVLIIWLLVYSGFLTFVIGWPHYMLLYLPFSYILLVSLIDKLAPITLKRLEKWKK